MVELKQIAPIIGWTLHPTDMESLMAKSTRPPVILSAADRQRLEEVRDHPQSLQKHVWRARIILTLGAGHGLFETVRRTGVSKLTVWRWWDRFQAEGIAGLWRDKTRPPGRAPIAKAKVAEVIQTAMAPPPEHASHWTLKALAHETGVAMSSVRTILRRHRLYPHRVSTFKVSQDPAFAKKIRDVVGLYVNPPDHAVVLSIDEKPQILALGRTPKPLPMTPGHTATRTHDYVRHDTTGLLTALDVATGRMTERHRSEDFVAFLDHVAEGLAADMDVHVILDNVSSHKSATVLKWLVDHPRWHFHFTPTSASWVNAVEGFFSKLARQRLKHAISNSLAECVAAVKGFIAHHNEHQVRPFRWSKSPDDWVQSWKNRYYMIKINH